MGGSLGSSCSATDGHAPWVEEPQAAEALAVLWTRGGDGLRPYQEARAGISVEGAGKQGPSRPSVGSMVLGRATSKDVVVWKISSFSGNFQKSFEPRTKPFTLQPKIKGFNMSMSWRPGQLAAIVPRARPLHGEAMPDKGPHCGCLNAGREPPGDTGAGVAPFTPTLTIRRSTQVVVDVVLDAHGSASPCGRRHFAQLTCLFFTEMLPPNRWGLSPCCHVALSTTLWKQAQPLTWAQGGC